MCQHLANWLLLGLTLIAPALCCADISLAAEAEIIIRAESASLDQQNGVGIYEGGAELHQGDRHLKADWIRIELHEGQPFLIQARGNPVTLVDTDILEARGERLNYDVAGRRIQIYEQAYVNHQGRIFEGAELEYNLDSKQVDARGGDEDGRVRLVIPAKKTSTEKTE